MMKHLFLYLTVLLSATTLCAQTTDIKKLEEQRKKTLQEIENTDKLLRSTEKNNSTLLNRITVLSKQISSRQKVVDLLNLELTNINHSQKSIEKEITQLEADLVHKQANYAKAVDGMLANRRGQNKALFILSGKSLQESYRRFRYLKDYSDWRREQADEIKESRDYLKNREQELSKTKKEKETLFTQRAIEQKKLKQEEGNFKKEARVGQKKQKELKTVLAQKKKQADALNRRIEKLIAEEVARQKREAEERAKKEGKTGPATATKEDIKLSGDFAANKGKLPRPVSGNGIIVNKFGTHQHAEWKVSTSSNGIDIQSQAGASALAAFNGVVTRVMAFPGYNNCIIIRHGDYYTFYGNIQSVSVKQGDAVKTGQSLGKIYTDSGTNQTTIHFQVWKGTNKMDPEHWIR